MAIPEIDPTNPQVLMDPYTTYDQAREQHPVARMPVPGLGTLLIERLLFLLFAFLFLLLLLSNLVISYTNLFRNRETTFLLSLPVPTRTIFQWKFIESTLLASWFVRLAHR